MVQNIPVSSYINTVSVPEPASLQNAAPDDVLQFEQALENSEITEIGAHTPTMPAGLIRDAISAFEKVETKDNAVISRLLASGSEITTSNALEFSAALHRRSLDFRFVGKLLDGSSRAVEKLTSVQ